MDRLPVARVLERFLRRNETIAAVATAARALADFVWLTPSRSSLASLAGRLFENWLLVLVAVYVTQAGWMFVGSVAHKRRRTDTPASDESGDVQRARWTERTPRVGRGRTALAWIVAVAVTVGLHVSARESSTDMARPLPWSKLGSPEARYTGRHLIDAYSRAIQDFETGANPDAGAAVEAFGQDLDKVAMRPDTAGIAARRVKSQFDAFFTSRAQGEQVPPPQFPSGFAPEFEGYDLEAAQSSETSELPRAASSSVDRPFLGSVGVDATRLLVLLAALVGLGIVIGSLSDWLGQAQPGCLPLLLMVVTAVVGVCASGIALFGREPWTHEWSRSAVGLCGISAACAGLWGLIGWNHVDQSRSRERSSLAAEARSINLRIARRVTMAAVLVVGLGTFPFLIERSSTPYGFCGCCGRDLGDETESLGGVAGLAWRKPAEATATWGDAPESATANVHTRCYDQIVELANGVGGMHGKLGTPVYRPPVERRPEVQSVIGLWKLRASRRER